MTIEMQTAFYMGQRQLQKGGLGHLWNFGGTERIYSKQIAPAALGEEWSFRVTVEGERVAVTTSGKDGPKQTGRWAAPELKRKWIAEDAAHVQTDREERANKALRKRETEIERVCRPLRELYASLRVHAEREAFLRAVTMEIRRGAIK